MMDSQENPIVAENLQLDLSPISGNNFCRGCCYLFPSSAIGWEKKGITEVILRRWQLVQVQNSIPELHVAPLDGPDLSQLSIGSHESDPGYKSPEIFWEWCIRSIKRTAWCTAYSTIPDRTWIERTIDIENRKRQFASRRKTKNWTTRVDFSV